MDMKLPAGKYIVAVSGGVDSMVLLDILRHKNESQLIVVHVDHGMRPDSSEDRKFVQNFAMSHNITFEFKELSLGATASEETARSARYNFLRQCRIKYNAQAILTAHHRDDVIETALIALLRGTGWRGLAPFVEQTDILRPLLDFTKDQLIGYARKHNVPWREDSTNADESYLRNYVRRTVIPTMDQKDPDWQNNFMRRIRKQQILRRTIETELEATLNVLSQNKNNSVFLRRYNVIMLPSTVSYELLQCLFKKYCGNTLERHLAEAALLFAKAARPGKLMQLNKNWQIKVTSTKFIVEPRLDVVS